MPAQTPHQINRLQLDIDCSSQKTAIATQSRLSLLMERQIPDLLEQVFNQYDHPTQIIRLDRLELDLGILSLDDWETQLREILPAKLVQCLADSLDHTSHQAAIEPISIGIGRLEALEHFLQSGQLPWNAHRQDFVDLDQAALNLIQEVKAHFRSLLERVMLHAHCRDRLRFNLTLDTLNQMQHTYPDLDWHWLTPEHQLPVNGLDQPECLAATAVDHWPELAFQPSLATRPQPPFSQSVQSNLSSLQKYLQSGQHPSTATAADIADLDGFVLRCLANEPVAFRQLLQGISLQPIARQRLWSFLSETTLSHILQISLEIVLEEWELLQELIVEVMKHLQRSAIVEVPNTTEAKRFCFEAFLLQCLNLPAAHLVDRFRYWLEYELSPNRFSSSTQWEDVKQITSANFSTSSALQVALQDCLWQHLSHLDQVFISGIDGCRSDDLAVLPTLNPSQPAIDLNSAQATGSNQNSEQANLLSLDSEQLPRQISIQEVIKTNSLQLEQTPVKQLQSLTDGMPRSDRSLLDISDPHEGSVWFIQNGGLVLLWTYLKRYFTTLHLIENGQFVDITCQMQAIHHLELLVQGVQASWQEYDLTLNKVLCGFPLLLPVDPTFNRNAAIVQEAEQLIHNAIRHWTIIHNTSINGFRRSFLQREGKLIHQATHWQLQVERKGYDVLLEHLPYPLGVIKLPWMARPLYVEW